MSFSYFLEEDILTGLLLPLISGVPSGIFALASYVLSSLALYTMAQRRQIHQAWMAWIPVLNCWIIGSLSDQYRYVVKGQIRSKRKILMVLNLLNLAMGTAMVVHIVTMIISAFQNTGHPDPMVYEFMVLLWMLVPLSILAAATAVFRFMALYDIYRSVDPSNAVLFLVLSILIHLVEPFFLFFNRDKDTGMPPRRPQSEPVQQAWEPEDKDYL